MRVYIDGTDITGTIIDRSISISREMQERIDSLSFMIGDETRPEDYDDVKCYNAWPILAVSGTQITLEYDYDINEKTSMFAVGDILTIDINETTELEKTITAVDRGSANHILLTVSPSGSDGTVGAYAGILEFGGNIIANEDENQSLLTNRSVSVSCLDYTRLFDKELLNDTYTDKDARYIINDFCNVTINYNLEIAEMEYDDSTDLQATWAAAGDASNREWYTADYREGTGCGKFTWVHSGGTATFTATISSRNGSDFTGVASGTPTKGVLGFHIRASDYTGITSIRIKIGSSTSDYAYWDLTPDDNNWDFPIDGVGLRFIDATIVGTPVWTAMDYLAVVVTETGSGNILLDGFRLLEEEFFRHFPYVEESTAFEDVRFSWTRPVSGMQKLADSLGWYWDIDYRRFIHFYANTELAAPFNLYAGSNNFDDLRISYDLSRLMNRILVLGGDETTTTQYSQIVEGDDVTREWIMKTRFEGLEVMLDDGSVTDTMEAGTNTTTVNATAHGLVEGDYIVNRTRSNAVRKVLTVPSANQFTVETVTGQTLGDTFSTFVAQTVAIEYINEDTGNDYMSSFVEKSIRAAEATATLTAGEFLHFRYYQVIPILVKRTENVSVANLKSTLGYTNGIIDGQPISDASIKSRAAARDLCLGMLNKYANVVLSATFKTGVHGLLAGMYITITDTLSSNRDVDQSFVIQKIRIKEVAYGELEYIVTCSSLLFGIVELLQQLLKQSSGIEIDEDAVIDNVEDAAETIYVSDTGTPAVDDNKQEETIYASDFEDESVYEPPFTYGSDPNNAIYNLSSYG